jgi:hypothetical protein
MDTLLAGTLILPLEGSLCRSNVQRRVACGNHSGLIVKTIPGKAKNRSPSRWNRRSPSARNLVHLRPGTLFTFTPESRSPSSGIRNRLGVSILFAFLAVAEERSFTQAIPAISTTELKADRILSFLISTVANRSPTRDASFSIIHHYISSGWHLEIDANS